MSAPFPQARSWDRIYVVTAMLLSVFLLAGAARSIAPAIVAWAPYGGEADSMPHPWILTFQMFHSSSVWMRAIMLPVLAWVSIVFALESRGASRLARDPKHAARWPQRVRDLAAALRQPLWWMVSLFGMVGISGVQLFVRSRTTPLSPSRVGDMLAWAHRHPSADPLLLWLMVWTAGAGCLFVVLAARVRAARLAAIGVASHRVYEDLPQGAVLGSGAGILISLVAIAWRVSPRAVPLVFLLVFASVLLSHTARIVAESSTWRFLPLILVALVIVGDIARGVYSWRISGQVWGFALACALIMIVVSRVHRRALYRAEESAPVS